MYVFKIREYKTPATSLYYPRMFMQETTEYSAALFAAEDGEWIYFFADLITQ